MLALEATFNLSTCYDYGSPPVVLLSKSFLSFPPFALFFSHTPTIRVTIDLAFYGKEGCRLSTQIYRANVDENVGKHINYPFDVQNLQFVRFLSIVKHRILYKKVIIIQPLRTWMTKIYRSA